MPDRTPESVPRLLWERTQYQATRLAKTAGGSMKVVFGRSGKHTRHLY